MAGLGEVCTHVAAILFFLETSTRINGTSTGTQERCKWAIPSFQKDIPYKPMKELDMSSAKSQKKKIDNDFVTPDFSHDSTSKTAIEKSSIPGGQERIGTKLQGLFQELSKAGTKPAILSLLPGYSDSYVPASRLESFPKPLQSLYDPAYESLPYVELLDACESITFNVTEEMSLAVEKATRRQTDCKLWYKYRAGRITASRLKQVCRTNHAMPAQSLVKAICYPEAYRFTSLATQWGCSHEKLARKYYVEKTKKSHENFDVADSGFVINPTWPHLGASPDGVVCCSCCGKGTLEIKCPYCHHEDEVEAVAKDPRFCLISLANGTTALDRQHGYYYQVQMQMFVCNVKYGHFVLCTFPSESGPSIHVERIIRDEEMWSECIEHSTRFFRTCILPELLGRWYTRPCAMQGNRTTQQSPSGAASSLSSDTSGEQRKYCYCQQPEDGLQEMIACDNPKCPIEWYHVQCLKLSKIPGGKWYCPDCRKLPELKVIRKGKRRQEPL